MSDNSFLEEVTFKLITQGNNYGKKKIDSSYCFHVFLT